jgi:copper chaperone
MKTLNFKTNINCEGCVAKISSHLEQKTKINNWEVNTDDLQKILTVETDLSEMEIKEIVSNAGFKVEAIE